MTKGKIDPEHFSELIDRYGSHSNAFLTRYPGYDYFCPERIRGEGAIAFLETKHALVGATEPVAREEDHRLLMREFAALAQSRRKLTLMLPVSLPVVKLAKPLGFGSLKIGSEPMFALDSYQPDPAIITTAKRLAHKGAKVREVPAADITKTHRDDFNSIFQEWMETRKMAGLGFVNRVEPWTLTERKKYFYVELKGRVLAFVAAVPIPARKGWYFVDVCRRGDSPPGSTELLILEAMRMVKSQGAKIVTLGAAPLADIDPYTAPSHQRLSHFLNYIFEHGSLFYNFESLYLFKRKFRPTHFEPMYLIFHPARLGRRSIQSIMEVFVGTGLLRAVWSGMDRQLSRFRLSAQLDEQLLLTTATRPWPARFLSWVRRCPLTLGLFAANVVCFFSTVAPNGNLSRQASGTFAFSVGAIYSGSLHGLWASPFLHWNLSHLLLNLTILVVFVGALECLAGTALTATVYLSTSLIANVLSVALLLLPIKILMPEFWPDFLSAQDVGASLGIYGGIGALSLLFRVGRRFAIGLAGCTLFYSLVLRDYLTLNHLMALGIGMVMGRSILGRDRLFKQPAVSPKPAKG